MNKYCPLDIESIVADFDITPIAMMRIDRRVQENWNTRETLLERAKKQDDHSAWNEFVHVYGKFIGMVITKSGMNIGDVEDLVQDVLVKVWKVLPNYEYRGGQSKFRTWLSVIIRNAISDHVNKMNRRGGQKFELDEKIVCQLTADAMELRIEEEWKQRITELAVENVKKHFSGQAVDVFLLSLEGANTQEIADELGLTVQSVYTLRKRVKTSLKKEIEVLRATIEFS